MPQAVVNIIAVAGGGAFGAALRYLTVVAGVRFFGTKFPVGTVAVNLVGCFVAGLIVGLIEERLVLSPTAHLLIFTGFLGGFTTLSAFSIETMNFMRGGAWTLAAVNIALNAVLGIVMALAGMLAARSLSPTPPRLAAAAERRVREPLAPTPGSEVVPLHASDDPEVGTEEGR